MKNSLNRLIAIFWVLLALTMSCSTIKKVATSRDIDNTLKKSPIFSNQFTGFVLFDPQENRVLKSTNGELSFIPASNTKILTTYACLNHLGDSLPTFLVNEKEDTLLLSPMGDPTFLHADFRQQPVIRSLADRPIKLLIPRTPLRTFGPGWAWDDYEYSFQTERSWMPIYGNEVRVINRDTLEVIPGFFENYVNMYREKRPGAWVQRDRNYNLFNIWMDHDTSHFERKIPFVYSDELLLTLLRDTLRKQVSLEDNLVMHRWSDTLYNSASLPAIALMMQRSDNFLAEQLLVNAARARGYTDINAFRYQLLAEWNLHTKVQWVDGSGLSRYNLISPMALVQVLHQIYQTASWEEIQYIFPTGGVSGTIRHWYSGNEPYVFAKTGTLSNNHNLSGFIKTNSGKVLIFSFMNNNYLTSVSDVKYEMQKILEAIRDAY